MITTFAIIWIFQKKLYHQELLTSTLFHLSLSQQKRLQVGCK